MKPKASKSQYHWSLLIPLSFAALMVSLAKSTWGDELRERAVAPLEFRLRDIAKRNPEISTRLKVVVYGDKAKKEFGVQELLPIEKWKKLIEDISSRNPRAIIFDKLFSYTLGSADAIAAFNNSLRSIKTPVIAAVAFAPIENADSEYYANQFAQWELAKSAQLATGNAKQLLGPAASIRTSFHKIGSILLNNTAAVEPAWKEAESGMILPQISLSFAEKVAIDENKVTADSSTLYLDRFNRIPVNFIRRMDAFESFIPAAPFFRATMDQKTLTTINNDDIVLILPSMYTGSTDFKNSPIGRIEGGLYHMSIINSLLTNAPLRPFFQTTGSLVVIFLVLAFVSTLSAIRPKFQTAIAVCVFLTISIIVLGSAGFVYASLQTDWHLYSAFVLMNGGTLLALRTIRNEKQVQRVEAALEGMVSPKILNAIKQKPDILYRRPNEQSLTVMFIDIEGFSLRTKELLSVDVFMMLHAQIDGISEIIHSHGGIVDRILGDGLMCFFGFNFNSDDKEKKQEHEEQALRCAIEIQRFAAGRTAATVQPNRSATSIIPLRIGLCSGEAFLGNLGSGKRIDFTIIGNTVNMAKRFEDACETFRVFMSSTTYYNLQQKKLLEKFTDVTLRPRLMTVKHQSELVCGWECDPFKEQQELFLQALKNSRFQTNDSHLPNEKHADKIAKVQINETDEGQILSFQKDTFTLIAKEYYCRKVYLCIKLVGCNEETDRLLSEAELKTIYMQVVAGSPRSAGDYHHTLTVMHLTKKKLGQLEKIISSQ